MLYPKPLTSDALVSHVDLVPTLAELLAGQPKAAALLAAAGWQGVSYADVAADPVTARPPQDTIVFTFDDFQYGQAKWSGFPFPPNHVRGIIEERWKVTLFFVSLFCLFLSLLSVSLTILSFFLSLLSLSSLFSLYFSLFSLSPLSLSLDHSLLSLFSFTRFYF